MDSRKPSSFRELLTPEDFEVPRRIVPPPYPLLHISNSLDGEEISDMHAFRSTYSPPLGHHQETQEYEMPLIPMDHGLLRDGIMFDYTNYYEFLQCWLDESNNMLFKLSMSPLLKRLHETITPTTHAEKSRIILPAGVYDRNELLHCDMIITGLPPSVFFGSGFGHKLALSRYAAAKDLVDKCFSVGLITEALHTSIGNHPFFEKKDLPRKDYSLAVDALADLTTKLSSQNWPYDFCSARKLKPDTFDRLKAVCTSVMDDVYFRGREKHRNEYFSSYMATNVSAAPNLVHGQEKMEFCHRCKLYGHMERHCRDNRSYSVERCQARSPPSCIPRMDYFDERDHRSGRYDLRNDINNDARLYSSDETSHKISQQREELLRRVMMVRHPLPGESRVHKRVTPQSLFATLEPVHIPQPLMSFIDGSDHPRTGPILHYTGSMLLAQQLRAAHDDEMLTKLEAKARKLEEKRLKQKKEELEWHMQKELEIKKQALEVEIRKKVQLEERAKLQMELSGTYQQVIHPTEQAFSTFTSQHLTSSLYPFSLFSSTLAPVTASSANEADVSSYPSVREFETEEIKRLVKEIGDTLLDLQRNCHEEELSVIFQSRALQAVAELGDNAHLLDRNQKQSLLRELKELLSHAGKRGKGNAEHRRSRSKDRDSCRGHSRDHRDCSARGSNRRSQSRSSIRGSYKRCKESSDFKEVRVQVGGMTMRNLSPVEQRNLKVGEIVVAEDVENGKCTSARDVIVAGEKTNIVIYNSACERK